MPSAPAGPLHSDSALRPHPCLGKVGGVHTIYYPRAPVPVLAKPAPALRRSRTLRQRQARHLINKETHVAHHLRCLAGFQVRTDAHRLKRVRAFGAAGHDFHLNYRLRSRRRPRSACLRLASPQQSVEPLDCHCAPARVPWVNTTEAASLWNARAAPCR